MDTQSRTDVETGVIMQHVFISLCACDSEKALSIADRMVKPYRKNWALKKPAHHGNVSEHYGASRAVDGDITDVLHYGSCSQTAKCKYPWWQVHLLEFILVDAVYIVTRGDCCGMYTIEV